MRVKVLGDFETYLATLKERLGLRQAEAQNFIDEVETHLHDKASDLQSQGIDFESARTLAVKHMGDPSDISRRMRLVYGCAEWHEILLAACPHLMIASLFLFGMCCNYFIIAAMLATIGSVAWLNWRNGNPSKWSYTWIGYAIAAPVFGALVALQATGYGAWMLLNGRNVPVFDPMVILLIGSAPFAMVYVVKLAHEMVKRDWLWLSLSALPLPILGSWVLFFHSNELYMGVHLEMLGQMDYTHLGVFVAMSVTTALYLKLGKRLLKVSLLLVSATALATVTSAAMPVGLHLPNLVMMFSAYLALFAAPVLWKALIDRQGRQQVMHSAVG